MARGIAIVFVYGVRNRDERSERLGAQQRECLPQSTVTARSAHPLGCCLQQPPHLHHHPRRVKGNAGTTSGLSSSVGKNRNASAPDEQDNADAWFISADVVAAPVHRG